MRHGDGEMKLSVEVKLNLKTEEAREKVTEAIRLGLRDTIVAIAGDAIKESPVKTANNRRSIFFGVAGMGHTQASGEGRKESDTWTGPDESTIDPNKLEAATYSTSGYGGFLETGTYKMAARPYFRPALDKNKDKLIPSIKEYLK